MLKTYKFSTQKVVCLQKICRQTKLWAHNVKRGGENAEVASVSGAKKF